MESILENIVAESEEEDYESFFLQPASSPYNIAEKVHQANMDLLSTNLNNTKISKVQFKENLVTFEPELTDDDVNSIESDPVETIEELPSVNYKTVMKISDESTIFDIQEEEEVEEELVEDEEEEILEEIHIDLQTNEKLIDKEEEEVSQESPKPLPKENTGKYQKKRKEKTSTILCKDHCIEKIDFPISIKQLKITEKPLCPPLKLHQRKCCDENYKYYNLPTYNGFRSEYGLTMKQLQRKKKLNEIVRYREQYRQKLIEEYKNRKTEQNEIVFRQWLKNISNRKQEKIKEDEKMHLRKNSPNVVNLVVSNNYTDGARPHTANERYFKPKIKKNRPHTSHSCIYIEVPHTVLQKGVHIGDLLITNSKLSTKKLHILTSSS